MLFISPDIQIPESEIEITSIRAQGPGGQNVNKVATAVHLRFNIMASSLPEDVRHKIAVCNDYRVSRRGEVVIKAQRYRNRERNIADARGRLKTLIESTMKTSKPRRKTRIPASVKQQRLDLKSRRGAIKRMRKKPAHDE